MFILFIAGAGGGLVRGLVGFIKQQFSYKNVKFEPVYFFAMMALSAFVGLVVTWAIASLGLSLLVVEQINLPLLLLLVMQVGILLRIFTKSSLKSLLFSLYSKTK